jgi:hypothetical protein
VAFTGFVDSGENGVHHLDPCLRPDAARDAQRGDQTSLPDPRIRRLDAYPPPSQVWTLHDTDPIAGGTKSWTSSTVPSLTTEET